MTPLRVSALCRSSCTSLSFSGMFTLLRTPSRPTTLRVLRHTSSMPYYPCIMVDTVMVVLIPLRMHLQIWHTDMDTA